VREPTVAVIAEVCSPESLQSGQAERFGFQSISPAGHRAPTETVATVWYAAVVAAPTL
jgi:hypothetical protein